jgi:hypothetical protein
MMPNLRDASEPATFWSNQLLVRALWPSKINRGEATPFTPPVGQVAAFDRVTSLSRQIETIASGRGTFGIFAV